MPTSFDEKKNAEISDLVVSMTLLTMLLIVPRKSKKNALFHNFLLVFRSDYLFVDEKLFVKTSHPPLLKRKMSRDTPRQPPCSTW